MIGQIATYLNLAPWYASLTKPSFNPPNWVFGPVWTALYLLMAFSVWRILRLPSGSMRRTALALFFVQLALNAAWSWMFFAANNPLLGMVNIVPQFVLIVATVVAFYWLDKLAAYCLVRSRPGSRSQPCSIFRSGCSTAEARAMPNGEPGKIRRAKQSGSRSMTECRSDIGIN